MQLLADEYAKNAKTRNPPPGRVKIVQALISTEESVPQMIPPPL